MTSKIECPRSASVSPRIIKLLEQHEICIRELADSLFRDGTNTPIVYVHWKAY